MPSDSFPLQVQFNKNLNSGKQKNSFRGESSPPTPFVFIRRAIVSRVLPNFYLKETSALHLTQKDETKLFGVT